FQGGVGFRVDPDGGVDRGGLGLGVNAQVAVVLLLVALAQVVVVGLEREQFQLPAIEPQRLQPGPPPRLSIPNRYTTAPPPPLSNLNAEGGIAIHFHNCIG
ncbi:hypothetical protein B1218_35800, partial [Pseudomonas ogarae]